METPGDFTSLVKIHQIPNWSYSNFPLTGIYLITNIDTMSDTTIFNILIYHTLIIRK
jgi:hypothetical protein